MSAKLMDQVWEVDVPRSQRDVLLVFAGHADQANLAWPSVELVAWKVGCSTRQVQRTVRQLVAAGLMEVEGYANGGRGRSTRYRIHLEKAAPKIPLPGKGDTVTSPFVENKGDTQMSPFEQNPDTQMSPFNGKGDKATSPFSRDGADSDPERVTFSPEKGDTQMSPEPTEEPDIQTTAVVAACIPDGGDGRAAAVEEMEARANRWILDRLPAKGDPQRQPVKQRLRDELAAIISGDDKTGWCATATGDPVPWLDRPAILSVMLGIWGSKERDRAHAALVLAVQRQKDPLPRLKSSDISPNSEAAKVLASRRDPTPGANRNGRSSGFATAGSSLNGAVPARVLERIRKSVDEKLGPEATTEEKAQETSRRATEWERHHGQAALR